MGLNIAPGGINSTISLSTWILGIYIIVVTYTNGPVTRETPCSSEVETFMPLFKRCEFKKGKVCVCVLCSSNHAKQLYNPIQFAWHAIRVTEYNLNGQDHA